MEAMALDVSGKEQETRWPHGGAATAANPAESVVYTWYGFEQLTISDAIV